MPPIGRLFCRAATCLLQLVVVAIISLPALSQNQPWDGSAFSAKPAAMLDAAKLPADSTTDSIVLLQENHFRFDAQGRMVQKWRVVVKILSPAGIDQWKSLEADYEPWHEQRPLLEARVITSGNAVHTLDPKTIAEAPVQNEDEDIYSDGRVVRAPVPALVPGAVLEEQITYTETAPLFEAGSIHRVYFGRRIPVQHSRLLIEAPSSLPIKYQVLLLPNVAVEKKELDGNTTLLFQNGPLAAVEESEPFKSFDDPSWPEVIFSLGKSWKDVADAYSKAVDEKILGADVKRFVEIAAKSGPERTKIINSLIDQLHSEVRYTGVEFGQSSLIPHSPAETLKHKFGDCKDKASLLVAMLRGSGIPAYLALLSTGPGLDTPKSLAGMGTFDHAIVFVPGAPDIWIDATAEDLKAGELPAPDQGRLALIVRPETDGLVLTPELPSSINRLVETREFFLPEQGPARVIETAEAFGTLSSAYRHSYGGAETKELHKSLEEYLQSVYLAEKLSKYEHANVEERSKPFFIRLEAQKAKRGNVDEDEAVVATPLGGLLQRLPQFLLETDIDPDDSTKPAGAADSKYKVRKSDLVLPSPYVTEWNYRIVPPPGYKLRALPTNETMSFGPAKLTREYSQNPDGTFLAAIHFDTVKRRWSPEEVESARKSIRELNKKDVPVIYFDQSGHIALQAGKIREALDIYSNLSGLHPKEALHHTQSARAFLVAGLGEAARAEAQRAVQLDPSSASAYKTLGWILEHDLVGRRFKKGFDPQGAASAYRKAKQLDPEDLVSPTQLAIVLEYDINGVRYSSGTNLSEAFAEYVAMKDKLEKAGITDNPLWTLAWAGRFKELKERTASLSSTPTRVSFSLVATAVLDGAPAAVKEATRLTSDDKARSTALISAAEQLVRIRRYQEAAELMVAGAQGNQQAASQLARAELFRKSKRFEEALYPETDLRRSVQLFFIKMFRGASGEELSMLLSNFSYSQKDKPKQIKNLGEASRAVHNQMSQTGLPVDTLCDMVSSLMQITSEGDEKTGFRLRVQAPGSPTQTLFVIKENSGFKLLGMDSGDAQAVGSYLLQKLIDSDLDASRRWLDWIREEQKRGGGDDTFSGKAFPHFWTKGQQADKDTIRYAAAALASAGEDPEFAVPVLLEGRSRAKTESEKRDFDFALAQAYEKLRNYADLLPIAQRLAESDKTSVRAFELQCFALRGLKKFTEAQQLAEERLKFLPDDLDAIHSLMRTASTSGNPKQTQQLADKLISSGKAVVSDFNAESWYALVAGSDLPAAIEVARRGVAISQNKDAPILHTLAALYAENGNATEARELILNAMTLWALDEPNSASWYIFGRIAEQYGVPDAAIKAYKRVETPEQGETIPGSTYELAQRRLAILTKAEPAHKGN